MAVTIRDIAREAGVSVMTVSNVINAKASVRADNRAKVDKAIHDLGYQVNLYARGLRVGRTGTIGVAVPDLDEPYWSHLASRLVRAGLRRGLQTLVIPTSASRQGELDALTTARLRSFDGTIMAAIGLNQKEITRVSATYPVVWLGERLADAKVDHFWVPNREGMKAAVAHLVDTGRRRIALIGGDNSSRTVRDDPSDGRVLRTAGYRDALDAAGLSFDPALVVSGASWSAHEGQRCVKNLLEARIAFDAVAAMTDSLAFGAMRALYDHGLRVPDDVAVSGFDDIDEAQYSIPRLTSVHVDVDALAEQALDILVTRMSGEPVQPPKADRTVGFTLQIRESTAGPHPRQPN